MKRTVILSIVTTTLAILLHSCARMEILYHTSISILAEPNNKNENIKCTTPNFETDYFRGNYVLDTKDISFNFTNITSETFYIIFNEGIIIYPDGKMEYIIGSDQATKTLTTKTVRLTGGFFVENSYTTETVNKELQVVPCVPNVNMKFKIMGELRAQLDEDDDARLIYPDRSKFHNALYENARDDIGKSLVVVLPMIIGGEKVVYNFYLKIDSVSLE